MQKDQGRKIINKAERSVYQYKRLSFTYILLQINKDERIKAQHKKDNWQQDELSEGRSNNRRSVCKSWFGATFRLARN